MTNLNYEFKRRKFIILWKEKKLRLIKNATDEINYKLKFILTLKCVTQLTHIL